MFEVRKTVGHAILSTGKRYYGIGYMVLHVDFSGTALGEPKGFFVDRESAELFAAATNKGACVQLADDAE